MSTVNFDMDSVEAWRQKKIVEQLESAKGNGTSCITIIVPPNYQMCNISKLLTREQGAASSIKSRVMRNSVIEALKSIQHRVKLISRPPPNGLAIFCGTVMRDRKEKKELTVWEPIQPLKQFSYLCDGEFHVEQLKAQLNEHDKYGFIVLDGHGTLFATVQGNHVNVLQRYTVALPKKHRRGGCVFNARHTYLTKVAEMAVHCFVGRDDQPNVKGLVVAGSADLKCELVSPKILDRRLLVKILKTVDVSYGMEKGLHQAIALATDVLGEVRLLKEQRLLERYFNELVVSVDSGKAACGLRETMAGLREGVVDTIVCWEQLSVVRYTAQHALTGQTEVIHYSPKKAGRSAVTEPSVREVIDSHRVTMQDPQQWSIVEQAPLVDWLAEHYREFGAQLSFISGNSELGNQFVQSFGGLGAILRYPVDFEALDMPDEECDDADEFDDFDHFDACVEAEPAPDTKPPDPKEEVLEFDEDDFEEDSGEEEVPTPGAKSPPAVSVNDSRDKKNDKGKEKLDDGLSPPAATPPRSSASATSGPRDPKADTAAPKNPSGLPPLLSKVKFTEKVFVPRPVPTAAATTRAGPCAN